MNQAVQVVFKVWISLFSQGLYEYKTNIILNVFTYKFYGDIFVSKSVFSAIFISIYLIFNILLTIFFKLLNPF